MKRLICEKDVMQAAACGKSLIVDDNTIVTAQATDVARERGVELVHGSCSDEPQATCCDKPSSSGDCCAAESHENASHHDDSETEPALSAEEMEKVIRAAIAAGIWTEGQLAELFGCGR